MFVQWWAGLSQPANDRGQVLVVSLLPSAERWSLVLGPVVDCTVSPGVTRHNKAFSSSMDVTWDAVVLWRRQLSEQGEGSLALVVSKDSKYSQ